MGRGRGRAARRRRQGRRGALVGALGGLLLALLGGLAYLPTLRQLDLRPFTTGAIAGGAALWALLTKGVGGGP